jgi:hypothetical protein
VVQILPHIFSNLMEEVVSNAASVMVYVKEQ